MSVNGKVRQKMPSIGGRPREKAGKDGVEPAAVAAPVIAKVKCNASSFAGATSGGGSSSSVAQVVVVVTKPVSVDVKVIAPIPTTTTVLPAVVDTISSDEKAIASRRVTTRSVPFKSALAPCYSRARAEVKAWLEWRLHRFAEGAKPPNFCASATRASNVLLIIGKSGCGKRSLVRDVIDEINHCNSTRRSASTADAEESRVELVDNHAVDSVQALLRITEEAVCLSRLQCVTGVQQAPVWLFPGFDGYSMTETVTPHAAAAAAVAAAAAETAKKFVPASSAIIRLLGIWGVLQQWDSKRYVNIPPVILTAQSLVEVEKMGLTSQDITKVFMGAFRTEDSIRFGKAALQEWMLSSACPFEVRDVSIKNAIVERFDGDFRRTVDELQLAHTNAARAKKHPELEGASCTVKLVPPSSRFIGTVARGLHQCLSAFVFQEAKKIQFVWSRGSDGDVQQQESLVYIRNFPEASVLKACGFVRQELARLRISTMKAVLGDYYSTLSSASMDSGLDTLEAYCISAATSVLQGGTAASSPCLRDNAELRAVVGIMARNFAALRAAPSADAAMEFCRTAVAAELSSVLKRYVLEETLSVYTALQAADPRNTSFTVETFGGMAVEDMGKVRRVVERHRLLSAADPRVALDVADLLRGDDAKFSLCSPAADIPDYQLVVDTRSLQDVEARGKERIAVKLLRGSMDRDGGASSISKRSSDLFFNSPSDAVCEILHLHAVLRDGEEDIRNYATAERLGGHVSLVLPGKYLPKAKAFVFYDEGVALQVCRDASSGKAQVVHPMALTKMRKEGLQAIRSARAAEQQVRLDAMNAFPGVDTMLWLYSYSGWHALVPSKAKDAGFPENVVNIADAWSFFSSYDFKKAVAAKDLLDWLVIHSLRFNRVSEETLNVVWPKASAAVQQQQAAEVPRRRFLPPPPIKPLVGEDRVAEPSWGKQRPDMSRGTAAIDDRSSNNRVQIYQKLRQLRLGCIETASHKNLVVADALELMRLKTRCEGIRPRVLKEAIRAAETSSGDGKDAPHCLKVKACKFCRAARQPGVTPEETAGAEICGGRCTFKAPRLTDVKVGKEAAFGMYAVRGFRSDLVPAGMQEDRTNPETNDRRIKTDEARHQLMPSLQEYTERVLLRAPGMSMSVFKDLYWCGGTCRCTPTCWCSLPGTFTLLRVNPGLKPAFESAVLAELEDLFLAWHAVHEDLVQADERLRENVPVSVPVLVPTVARYVLRCLQVPSAEKTDTVEDTSRKRRKAEISEPLLQVEEEMTNVPGRYKQWTRNGKLHRANDLPARIEYTSRGVTLSYFFDGVPFRSVKNLPHVWHQLKHVPCICRSDAVTVCNCNAQHGGDQYVWLDALERPHREDDFPAVVGPGRFKQWYCHGMLHRASSHGPAQITENGIVTYYEHGVPLS